MIKWGPWIVADLRDVNHAFRELEQTLKAQAGWSTENRTANVRTLDANAATLAEVREVLATLIEDLKVNGGITK